jgi:hypothetical protein
MLAAAPRVGTVSPREHRNTRPAYSPKVLYSAGRPTGVESPMLTTDAGAPSRLRSEAQKGGYARACVRASRRSGFSVRSVPRELIEVRSEFEHLPRLLDHIRIVRIPASGETLLAELLMRGMGLLAPQEKAPPPVLPVELDAPYEDADADDNGRPSEHPRNRPC